MTDGFVPPRVSSSPPPFEDTFNDVDSVDSLEKDIVSKRIDFTDPDFDPHDEVDYVISVKPLVVNGHKIKSLPVPSEAQNGIDVSRDVTETASSVLRNHPDHASDYGNGIFEKLPENRDVEQSKLAGVSLNATSETSISPAVLPVKNVDAANLPDYSIGQADGHAQSALTNLRDVQSPIPPPFTEPDNEEESSLSDNGSDHGSSFDDTLMNSEVLPALKTGITVQREVSAQNNEVHSTDDSLDIPEDSEWANFAGASEEVAAVASGTGSTDMAVAVVEDENDEDWGDFSDFASSAPEEQSAVVKNIPEAAQPLRSPENEPLFFSDTIAKVFPQDIELPGGLSITPLDLNRSSDLGSRPKTTTGDGAQVWTLLKDLDETNALKFHWGSSSLRQALLRSLNLSYHSAFSMQKSETAALSLSGPGGRMGGNILVPIKLDQSKNVASNGLDSANIQESKSNSTSFSNNQLLDFLGPSGESSVLVFRPKSDPVLSSATKVSPAASVPQAPLIPVPQHSAVPVERPSRNGITLKQKNDVDDVLARFRSLNFMQSTVLVVPKKVAKF